MSRLSIRWRILIAIFVLIALRIYFWGGPIRTKYRIVRAPEKFSGAAGQWVIERQGNNPQRWIARDIDSDGTWDEFATPEGTFTRPGVQSLPTRWLAVCVDGVPLTAMQSLWDRGHFREFFRPTATVSSLPSDTETALTEALHAAPVPGYEHRYYDRATNRMRGGAWVTLSGANIPYIRRLNYDPPGWAKALAYIMPRKTYRADVGRFRKRFLGSRASVFLAHLASSDALLHLKTVDEVEPLLIEFENALREIYLDAHGDLGVIVFSDHGNTQTPSHSAPLEPFLTKRGWRVRESIEEPRDIAIPSYGLVGFAAIYCRPESIEQLADQLRRIEGADVIVSRHLDRKGATIRAAASATTAELEWTPDGRRYRYIARDGDPLGLVAIFDELRAAGKLSADGFASEGDLFAATSSASYPDSAARIRVWATNHVRSPADILVSFKPGYYHGARQFQQVVSFAGTHGGLEKSSSLGFAMATYPLAPAVRLGDLLPGNLLGTTTPGRAAMISPQQAPPASDNKYAPPYYLDCGREAPYKSRSARTGVLSSPDGSTDAYGETKARAEGRGCSNTSAVYVRQNGGTFQLVFFQAPTEVTLGNGVRLIDWSKDATKLLFNVLRWQYGSDAAPGNNLWIYSLGVLKRVPLNRISRGFGEGCFVSFEPLGFSATGEVAMRFSAKQDYDEEGEAVLPKCQEKRIAWLFDPMSNRLTQTSYEYSVQKWGRLR